MAVGALLDGVGVEGRGASSFWVQATDYFFLFRAIVLRVVCPKLGASSHALHVVTLLWVGDGCWQRKG